MHLKPAHVPDSAERRKFLKHSLGLVTVAASPLALGAPESTSENSDTHWSNWSGSQKSVPKARLYPASEADLAAAVRDATGPVRAVGGGHSFSPVVNSRGTLVSLEALNGIVSHNRSSFEATLWAGTRIAQASPELAAVGQAFPNEADINMQSVAGAISTATHGTGRQLKCYSAYITKLRLITASGEITECSASENPELFQAARVAVGSLGIITQVTFRNRSPYRLREIQKVMNLNEAMQMVDREKDKHEHIEFWAFPFGDKAIVKIQNETQDPPTKTEEPFIDENNLLDWAADTARLHPWTNKWLQRALGLFVSDMTRVGNSYDIYASPRAVPFNEMEYQLPAARGMECLEEMIAVLKAKDLPVFFPIEFRYVKGDDCWLSPFYQRDSVSISFHQYYKQDYKPVFKVIEPIFWKYQGRPHWGKLHTLGYKELTALYPRFEDFRRVRAQMDPAQKFLNEHMKKVFGV